MAALNARGAGAEDYAAKLPGLAKLSGLQGIRDVHARSQRDLGDLAARTPSLIASSLRDARNREVNKAVAGLGAQTNIYGVDARAASSAASTGASLTNTGARIKAQQGTYDEAQSRQRGHLVHKDGTPITRANGGWIPYKPKKTGKNKGGPQKFPWIPPGGN